MSELIPPMYHSLWFYRNKIQVYLQQSQAYGFDATLYFKLGGLEDGSGSGRSSGMGVECDQSTLCKNLKELIKVSSSIASTP